MEMNNHFTTIYSDQSVQRELTLFQIFLQKYLKKCFPFKGNKSHIGEKGMMRNCSRENLCLMILGRYTANDLLE